MADLRSIRRRITSIRSSQKIAEAMRMVSTARFTRLESKLRRHRDYMSRLAETVGRMQTMNRKGDRPKALKQVALHVLFSSDRGLCGGFNQNLVKYYLAQPLGNPGRRELIVLGRQGTGFLREREIAVSRELPKVLDAPTDEALMALFRELSERYNAGGIAEVVLFYNRFDTFLTQTPTSRRLFPVEGVAMVSDAVEFKCEPSHRELGNHLYPMYAERLFRLTAMESLVAEHAARMNAMSNASRNASELLEKLRLQYNKIRQEKITLELMEIIAGTEAQK